MALSCSDLINRSNVGSNSSISLSNDISPSTDSFDNRTCKRSSCTTLRHHIYEYTHLLMGIDFEFKYTYWECIHIFWRRFADIDQRQRSYGFNDALFALRWLWRADGRRCIRRWLVICDHWQYGRLLLGRWRHIVWLPR